MHPLPLPFESIWVIAMNAEEKPGSPDCFWSEVRGWVAERELAKSFVFFEDAQEYIREHSAEMSES
jgi:hypothetical protein